MDMNAKIYLNLLGDHAHCFMQLPSQDGDDYFQQDNAPYHTAVSSPSGLRSVHDSFGLILLQLPHSPDLNPIEKIWIDME